MVIGVRAKIVTTNEPMNIVMETARVVAQDFTMSTSPCAKNAGIKSRYL